MTNPIEVKTRSNSKLSMTEQFFGCNAIRKLDVDGVREMCVKIGIPVLGESNDVVLAIAHHARCKMPEATQDEKSASENWLRFRNLM